MTYLEELRNAKRIRVSGDRCVDGTYDMVKVKAEWCLADLGPDCENNEKKGEWMDVWMVVGEVDGVSAGEWCSDCLTVMFDRECIEVLV